MASILVDPDQFNCPVCRDILNNPVTTPCGHSFCLGCINACWDQQDLKRAYSCPQCRRSFSPRPVLSKNVMLAEMMEKLKLSSGGESVECDVCTGRKLRAVKSCLVCLASYCETHLQPHHQSPAFKKHKLVEASRRLREQICSEHEKLLEVYCRTDQQCICMLCTMDYHRGHDTVSAAAERAERQNTPERLCLNSQIGHVCFTSVQLNIRHNHALLRPRTFPPAACPRRTPLKRQGKKSENSFPGTRNLD
ncbi:hypothetical protein NFI96_008445 [Prochilodus magdalenae]|nr:hypothetical protein NFI96_008445 [Prochilodus magdalenae]